MSEGPHNTGTTVGSFLSWHLVELYPGFYVPESSVAAAASSGPVSSVDDFVPEEGIDSTFLDDTKDAREVRGPSVGQDEDSDR